MSAQGLPAHILALFSSRPPTEDYRSVYKGRMSPVSYVSGFMAAFECTPAPPRIKFVTPRERRREKMTQKQQHHKQYLEKEIESYDPQKEMSKEDFGDPFKTLFVARLSYDTTEKKLKREFESWGAIKRVKLVACSKTGKPRGYAFIEYEYERDLKNAYKQADGKRIDGRRVMVDVERGRTVPKWLPIRLGGGRGGRKPMLPKKGSAADRAREAEKRDRERAGERRSRERRGPDREKERPKDREKEREKDRDRRERPRDRDHKDREKEHKKDRGDRDRDRGRDRESTDKKIRGDDDRDRKRRRTDDGERDRKEEEYRERPKEETPKLEV